MAFQPETLDAFVESLIEQDSTSQDKLYILRVTEAKQMIERLDAARESHEVVAHNLERLLKVVESERAANENAIKLHFEALEHELRKRRRDALHDICVLECKQKAQFTAGLNAVTDQVARITRTRDILDEKLRADSKCRFIREHRVLLREGEDVLLLEPPAPPPTPKKATMQFSWQHAAIVDKNAEGADDERDEIIRQLLQSYQELQLLHELSLAKMEGMEIGGPQSRGGTAKRPPQPDSPQSSSHNPISGQDVQPGSLKNRPNEHVSGADHETPHEGGSEQARGKARPRGQDGVRQHHAHPSCQNTNEPDDFESRYLTPGKDHLCSESRSASPEQDILPDYFAVGSSSTGPSRGAGMRLSSLRAPTPSRDPPLSPPGLLAFGVAPVGPGLAAPPRGGSLPRRPFSELSGNVPMPRRATPRAEAKAPLPPARPSLSMLDRSASPAVQRGSSPDVGMRVVGLLPECW